MSQENNNDRDRMRLFTPKRSPDIDRAIQETIARLENTRAFLKRIGKGEEPTRLYVEQMTASLEGELRRLENKKSSEPSTVNDYQLTEL